MKNITIKCLDMIFLTDSGCMIIIRLLSHQKTPKKLKKAQNLFEGQIKGHHSILSNLHNFLGSYGPFGSQNSSTAIFFISKAFKAKKATKRPKIANLRKWKGLGPKMVSQGPKQSYKVIWRPYRTPFSHIKILKAKKGPLGS